MGAWGCIGDWYMSCCGDIRKGLTGVGETDGIGVMGAPIAKEESCIRLGMAIRFGFISKPRVALSQAV